MSVLTTTPLKAAPSAAAGVSITAGTTPTWGAWVEVVASTAAPIAIAGVQIGGGTYSAVTWELDLGVGAAGAETSIGTLRLYLHNSGNNSVPAGVLLPVPLGGIGSGVRVAVRARASGGTPPPATVALNYYESLSSDQVTTSAQVLSASPLGASTVSLTPSGTAWANSAWVELIASASGNLGLLGLSHAVVTAGEDGIEYDIGTGAASAETVITTLREAPGISKLAHTWLPGAYPVVTGTRVALRMRKAGTNTTTHAVTLVYYTGVDVTEPPEATITSEAPVAESLILMTVPIPIAATMVTEAPVPASILRATGQHPAVFAEVDLNDRKSYYGGYKAPLVLRFQGARRGMSDREGNLEHLQFGATLSDSSGYFRSLLASSQNKYLLNQPLVQRVITDAARRLEEEAWIVANGFVSDYAPLAPRQFKISGQDWLKKKFAKNVNAGAWQPVVRAEDFPNANNVYQQNIGRIIPIIYGRITDTRLSGPGPTSDYGDGQLVPIYGGDTVLLGETWAIGIIAAHHCDYLEAGFWLPDGLNGVDLESDPDWLTPRNVSLWAAAGFTRPFQTINGRDYFVIYVKGVPGENLRVGEPVNNDQAITVNVWGRTDTGDEFGTLLTNGFDIYEDFLLNYVCPDTPWVSGPPLPMPTFGPSVGSAPYVDLASLAVCRAVAEARLDGGYQLDFALGATNETWSLTNAIAEFNKCLDCEGYINHYGAYALTMEPDSIDAAAIIEVAAPLTDVHDIVAGGLTIADQTKDFWNVVPFRHTFDYCNRNQRHAWNSPWRSLHSGIHEIRHDPSVARYEQERVASVYEFFFIRGKNRDTDSEYYWQGTLMALDIVSRVVARYANPRRVVQITTALNGLQYDIGDIVPVSAQDGIGVTGWTDRRIRVTGHEVLATTGQVVLDGYDFDAVLEAADDWARLAKT